MDPDPHVAAKAFVLLYCSTFDGNRAGLARFYRHTSTLSFEGIQIQGSQNIVSKLTTLSFLKFHHQIFSINCLPAAPGIDGAAGVLAYVWGEFLLVGESVSTLRFSQVFHLMPTGRTFYVFNHIFRLHYA